MNCTDVKEAFVDFVDSPPTEKSEAGQHIARCPDCRRSLEEYRHVVAYLRSLAQPQPAADMVAKVREKTERHGRVVHLPAARPWGLVILLMIMVTAGTAYWHSSLPSPSAAPDLPRAPHLGMSSLEPARIPFAGPGAMMPGPPSGFKLLEQPFHAQGTSTRALLETLLQRRPAQEVQAVRVFPVLTVEEVPDEAWARYQAEQARRLLMREGIPEVQTGPTLYGAQPGFHVEWMAVE